ncbi:hypothetical protein HA402_004073 [Bradysia odoriphaga]|nr:hypothetical protein HA402_004073 [Bradysia odoriphaga]
MMYRRSNQLTKTPTTSIDHKTNLTQKLFYVLKPLHSSSDHGSQQLDENPFSHLALEIEMDRLVQPKVSSNPFDNGVMPSFDDRAIDEDYRNETAKKFGADPFGRNHVDRQHRPATRQSTKEFTIPPLLTNDVRPIDTRPPARIVKDVNAVTTTTAATVASVRESTIVKKIPDVDDELDLDDFPPKPPVMSSIDLKPQINIRSRGAVVTKEDAKPRFNAPIERKPIVHPAPVKPVVHAAPIKPVVHPAKLISHPALTKPVAQSAPTKPAVHAAGAKPIIDYFGTNSSDDAKQEVDQKEEYFRESQIEANKMLFGVAEPTRPLTNNEVSKRKKLILKLVDQKLKQKLTELMSRLSERADVENSAQSGGEHNDSFADQLENLVPDSIPDNANPEPTQNWTAYPSEASEQTWNNFQQTEIPNPQDGPWPVRPPYQQNPGWMAQPMNLYPPGVDPMQNNRFPRMPPMRPQWNASPWQPHMRPPDLQWQQQQNWNMPGRPMNPHLMQPNINLLYPVDKQLANSDLAPFPVPPVGPLPVEKPAAEIELELKEKEFLERTLMGTKNSSQRKHTESHHFPEKSRRRSPPRQRRFSRDRERDRDRKRSPRDRSRRDNRSPHSRSAERIAHRNVISPSELSPFAVSPPGPFRNRSISVEDIRELMYDNDDHFEPPPMQHYASRSRSRDSRSEDLRVRLSTKRQNRYRSRSPVDLRNKLTDNRHTRNDDLRHHLAGQSNRKRSRSGSTRSRSRGQSSKKMTRLDGDDSEWQKFNNIVGMLMNIDRDAELTSEEMVERKEIMRLLLENPDLLELDDKFVYKFGKGRLNLAVKEAENILYPNGVPDERIASLISKKIAALPIENKKPTEAKDTIPIEWIKLGNIIDQMLRLTLDERKNLTANDKRMLERDELLLKISDDPNSLLKLATKYGHRNVEWASKYAYRILYRNGIRDKRVDKSIAKERKRAMERIATMRKSRNSAESHKSAESDSRSSSSEWNHLTALVTKLVQSSLENFEKMTREDARRRDELLVQMSRDPDSIRSDTKFTDNIDKAVVEDTIKQCKEIIASVKSNSDKSVITEFERQRTKLINILNSKTQRTTAYDQILLRLSGIFGKKQGKWTADEKKEREMLTEAMIKDPESLRTNTNALERIGDDKLAVDEIIADVKQILSQLDPSRARGPKKFHISHTKVIDIPFVVKIEDASDQLDDTTKTVLLKALREMITEIENPPKPKLLQQRYIDRRVEVVCANLLTFEWLKRVIVSDFKDKWVGADLRISRVPVDVKIPRDKLKSVEVVFKDNRATLPFDEIVRELRRENSKLYPERWELQDSRGKSGDYKKKIVGIDIESLAALEQANRFAHMGRSLVYFDISYMGENVPNFEATCQ